MRFGPVLCALLSVVLGMAVATAPVAVAGSAVPNLQCRYQYVVQSGWLGGYQAELTVRNLGPDTASPWLVTLVLGGGGQIKTSWPGPFTQAGNRVQLSGPAWERDLHPGWSTRIGVTVSYTGSVFPLPSEVRLNGVACTAE